MHTFIEGSILLINAFGQLILLGLGVIIVLYFIHGILTWINSTIIGHKILESIYSYVILFCFLSFLGYLFYVRIVMEKFPRNLTEPMSTLQKYICLYIIAINVIILLILIFAKIKEKWFPDKEGIFSKIGKSISQAIDDYILKPLVHKYFCFTEILFPNTYEPFVITIYVWFHEKIHEYSRLRFFYGVLIIPKVIVLVCFLCDVFVYKELYVFYKVLWLLMIPLLFRFIYMIYMLILTNTPERLMEALNESPCAVSDEQWNNSTLELPSDEESNSLMERNREYDEFQKNAYWFQKFLYAWKLFLIDLRPKDESAEYAYHLRCYITLFGLQESLLSIDEAKHIINFPLNLILRLGYIAGWVMVLILQMMMVIINPNLQKPLLEVVIPKDSSVFLKPLFYKETQKNKYPRVKGIDNQQLDDPEVKFIKGINSKDPRYNHSNILYRYDKGKCTLIGHITSKPHFIDPVTGKKILTTFLSKESFQKGYKMYGVEYENTQMHIYPQSSFIIDTEKSERFHELLNCSDLAEKARYIGFEKRTVANAKHFLESVKLKSAAYDRAILREKNQYLKTGNKPKHIRRPPDDYEHKE